MALDTPYAFYLRSDTMQIIYVSDVLDSYKSTDGRNMGMCFPISIDFSGVESDVDTEKVWDAVYPFLEAQIPTIKEHRYSVQVTSVSYHYIRAIVSGVRYVDGAPTNEEFRLRVSLNYQDSKAIVYHFWADRGGFLSDDEIGGFDYKEIYKQVKKQVKQDLKGIDGLKSFTVREIPLILITPKEGAPRLVYRVEVVIDGGVEDAELAIEYIVIPK